MPLLSSPTCDLRFEYDVVIIGSGYGGAVAASALARASTASGQSLRVCLLERGKEIPVGHFPSTPADAARAFQVNAGGEQIGAADALYWLHAGPDISVFQGCGLGGTSLVNANVSLPPEPRVWKDPRWPAEIVADLADELAAGFARAKRMLNPSPYPGTPKLAKFEALQRSARAMGEAEQCYQPPINVNFKAGLNNVGVEQPSCDGCGDCVGGCNVGAKNTLMMNYLPDAKNHGAQMFCSIRVESIERVGTRWRVHFQPITFSREVFAAEPLFIEADLVVVAAGTLGTNEIMLRSKAKGLACSDRVGERFSGNGDFLGFAYNNDIAINGIGAGRRGVDASRPAGPCISGIIDLRSDRPVEQAMVIEEGVIPGSIAPLLTGVMEKIADFTGHDTDHGFWDEALEEARELESKLPGGAYRGAMQNTQTFLVMSHDGADGKLRLRGSTVEVAWPNVGARPHFAKMSETLQQATRATGGTYMPAPVFNRAFGRDLITVHPLGGCAMAETAEYGVTNHKGQVFASQSGSASYDNLYISDGSIMPCSLGVNPLLTISAIAERNAHLLAREHGWSIDEAPNQGRLHWDGVPTAGARTQLQFTEKMAGHVSTSTVDDADFERAEARGRQEQSPCHFVLTVTTDDLDAMIRDPLHAAKIVGSVSLPALSTRPLMVFGGDFNLFVTDPRQPHTKRMRYRMAMRSADGEVFFFDGYKLIHDDPGFDVWSDTTTLYVSIHRGTSGEAPQVARGILHIAKEDFARQMTTMKAIDANGDADLLATARFGRLFASNLWDVYGVSMAS